MKTNLIVAIMIIGMTTNVFGQDSSDIYLFGESITAPEKFTGFYRSPADMSSDYITPALTFIIRSIPNGYEMWLMHYNYNLEELRKIRPVFPDDTVTIVDMPISKLQNLQVIDINQFLRTKTREKRGNG